MARFRPKIQIVDPTRDSNMLIDSTASSATPAVSFVFPCLNEERTLATCIEQAHRSLGTLGVSYEVILSDNGSTDGSILIAESSGCRVVNATTRGYGAALSAGIASARGRYVMFADSDNTYLYENAAALYRAASSAAADMAIASRMKGRIEPGSMPFLHRRLGTPILTALINLLFEGQLSDCNSGFRCVRKAAFDEWQVRATGMEFASELLIKALKQRAVIVEIPSGLRPGPAGRVAHLRTWRDGMRHLLFILSEKPALFERLGLFLLICAATLQAIAALTGPINVGKFNIFDIHSQALLLMMGIIGTQFYVFGCSLFLSTPDRPLPLTRRLIDLNEGVLFFCLIGVLAISAAVVIRLVLEWAGAGFGGLHAARQLLVAVHFIGTLVMAAIGLLSIHTLKKARGPGK